MDCFGNTSTYPLEEEIKDVQEQSNEGLLLHIQEADANFANESLVRSTADDLLQSNITNEQSARVAADQLLQSNIDSEQSARINSINTLQSELDSEQSARIAQDNILQSNIGAEQSARISNDATLQLNIDSEQSARVSADQLLQSNIDTEQSARTQADTNLQLDIGAEALARSNADNDLLNAINNIPSGIEYQGMWNSTTNTPTLTSGVGTQGHYYIVCDTCTGGTNLDGTSDWVAGDWVIFSSTSVWQRVGRSDQVSSVAGKLGVVILDTNDVTEGNNLYYTDARFDTRLATKSTTNLAEGSNLYYTDARFDTRLTTKTTSDVAEGSNLYYTDARFDTRLATKTTSDVAEGSNLYYTDARVDTNPSVVANTAHRGDLTLHRKIADTKVGTIDLWSSQKIYDELLTKVNLGDNIITDRITLNIDATTKALIVENATGTNSSTVNFDGTQDRQLNLAYLETIPGNVGQGTSYPDIPITGLVTGNYTVSASSTLPSDQEWWAWDIANVWCCTSEPYPYSAGIYQGAFITNGYSGEWVQLQHTTPLTIGSFDMRINGVNNAPIEFKMFWSNDGITWTEGFDKVSEVWNTTGETKSYTLPSPVTASYFRFVLHRLTGAAACCLYNITLYEFISNPASLNTNVNLNVNQNLVVAGLAQFNDCIAADFTNCTGNVAVDLSAGSNGQGLVLPQGASWPNPRPPGIVWYDTTNHVIKFAGTTVYNLVRQHDTTKDVYLEKINTSGQGLLIDNIDQDYRQDAYGYQIMQTATVISLPVGTTNIFSQFVATGSVFHNTVGTSDRITVNVSGTYEVNVIFNCSYDINAFFRISVLLSGSVVDYVYVGGLKNINHEYSINCMALAGVNDFFQIQLDQSTASPTFEITPVRVSMTVKRLKITN